MPDPNNQEFVKIATLDEVQPGKMLCVQLNNKNILLANDANTIYASDEMCTHEDASLCLGSLKGHLLKCPLHGSRFDLKTGQPLEDPADEPLQVYPVKIVGNNILIKAT